MKTKLIPKKLWNQINEDDGSISIFEENPIPALQNNKLKQKTIKVATSGGDMQVNPGTDIYRNDNGKIDKDWYAVREYDKDNMILMGPIKDAEHHFGKIPNRVLRGKKK
ncbi:hypothetical protein HYS72_01740 [Candidatus Pacearchaeota archaeon]|nr:hypothetical protein [Candidatus Pacearchaeota archaeon]MBI2056703.1 hypothetical protein [Candidatus Pacearchaeota archaeon]